MEGWSIRPGSTYCYMEKADKTIKLNYPDEARFLKDYRFIRKGKMAVPMSHPPAEGKVVCLQTSVPHLSDSFSLYAVVEKSIDQDAAKETGRKPGMIVAFTDESKKTIAGLERELGKIESYCRALGLEAGQGGSKEQGEEAKEAARKETPETAPEEPPPSNQEQKKAPPKAAGNPPPPPMPEKPILQDHAKAGTSTFPPQKEAEGVSLPSEEGERGNSAVKEAKDQDEPEVKTDSAESEKGASASSGSAAAAEPDKAEAGEDEGRKSSKDRKPFAPRPRRARVAQVKDKVDSSANIELEWVRDIINQPQAEEEEEEKSVYEAPPAPEKKQLTSEERSRVQPAGEFVMNLTKAMQRSGYYSEDHPESKGAKHGLYEELQKAVGDGKELMITNQETREKTDILMTGILDQPVSIRTVIGPGMAEMFVPRLREYFNRKALVSFALKKEITPEHFDSFVDIMSDPQVDRGSESGVGELLTNALVENGITEISTVFMGDMLVLEEKFPWRVEMAIQRLAKDLKVLPMFKGKSDQELKKMKHQTVMDIIRPVMHPQFLKDILINTYIIARHVKTLELKELEELIVESLPPQVILSTAGYVLEEMKRLQEKQREHSDSQVLAARIKSIKRILKSLSRRLVLEEIKGGRGFLEELYFNEILTLEELPPEVRARVNTLNLAESVKNSAQDYARAIASTRDSDEAYVLLECFKKVSPVLVEQGAWQELLTLVQGVNKASESSQLFQGGEGLPAMPLIYIFSEEVKDLGRGYMEADKESRPLVDKIVSYLGPTGVAVMGEVLLRSEDRGVRKAAVESLVKMREKSLYWVRHVLDDSTQPWYVQRNALLILSRIGQEDEDRKRARRFLSHSRPRLREEALSTVLRLEGKSAEDAVFKALDDEDKKVVGRAASSLSVIQPLSEAASERILQRLRVQMPKDREEAKEVAKKTAPLIRSLANLTDIPRFSEIEDALVELLKSQTGGHKKGFLKRLRNVFEDEEEPILLQALVDCLARIGGEKALPALEPLQEQEGDMGNLAQKAVEKIRLRTEEK